MHQWCFERKRTWNLNNWESNCGEWRLLWRIVLSSTAAEPFEIYQWPEVSNESKNSTDTILIGCYRDKKHLEWILSNHLYNIRLGRCKGSAYDKPECLTNAVKLYLYNLNDPARVSVYEIKGNKEMSGKELSELGYPRKSPGK